MKFVLALSIYLVSMGILPLTSEAYEVIDVKNGGAITGKIAFSGSPPAPAMHLITKDQSTCGKGKIEIREIDTKGGALRGVIVFLEKVKNGKAFSKAASHAVVDQKKCVFKPYLVVARNKSKLTIKNSDPVLHNIHAYELIGKLRRSMFNIAQPKSKPKTKKKLRTRRGGLVRFECDAHDWMLGFMYVAKNPYYAIVGADGSYSIGDIPPGNYTLNAWHPVLGVQKKQISVAAGGKASASFSFSKK
ncbi:MAG: hypothetical protein HOC91_18845 [Nitrospinaceae bacterium]|nr:hypothetical protein [Nitrospinaceae bacterium]MBT3433346.1 hypothetical protein [Nitrospinaceae bacterium]MBT3820310.1 hypothetical protein [Nitrospinaceae bacterium]MBT4092685.1 hypothetical protein [Nitrospinaceae bacterium]MBT4432573.1 hypothetical protein [Nitrospinaceae bacterium]